MSKRGYWLPKDASGNVIQVGGSSQITDANASASPLAVVTATGAQTVITVPAGAVQVHFCPDQTMFVSPDASAGASHGVRVPADVERTFNVCGDDVISAIASVAGNISFYFTMLDGDNDAI